MMPKGAYNRGKGKGLKWLKEHVNHQSDDCLIWPFARNNYGYGQLGIEGKIHKAHRWMCSAVNGPPPEDKPLAAHECGNGHLGCVHPKHLFWKDNSDNQKDRRAHGSPEGAIGRKTRLKPEQIALIQSSKGTITQEKLAADLGVKRGTIEYWRRKVA